MNARKIIFVLGIVTLLLLAIVVALSLIFHKKEEGKANFNKTQKAREARHVKKEAVDFSKEEVINTEDNFQDEASVFNNS